MRVKSRHNVEVVLVNELNIERKMHAVSIAGIDIWAEQENNVMNSICFRFVLLPHGIFPVRCRCYWVFSFWPSFNFSSTSHNNVSLFFSLLFTFIFPLASMSVFASWNRWLGWRFAYTVQSDKSKYFEHDDMWFKCAYTFCMLSIVHKYLAWLISDSNVPATFLYQFHMWNGLTNHGFRLTVVESSQLRSRNALLV